MSTQVLKDERRGNLRQPFAANTALSQPSPYGTMPNT
jgi:hypothetical protein